MGVVGAYRGSNAMKVEELTGIADLRRLMQDTVGSNYLRKTYGGKRSRS